MGYGRKIYELARQEVDRRRHNAEQIAQQNLQKFYAECPEAGEIKSAMARNAASIARTVCSGGDVRKNLEQLKDNAAAYRAEFNRLLAEHHFSEDFITPQYSCPDCKDTGLQDGKLCHCFLQLERSIAYQELSMSVPLENSRFETFSLDYYEDAKAHDQMSRIYRACRNYANSFHVNSRSLLFKGSTGLGKTHLSLAIAGEALQKGYGVIYSSTQSLAALLEKERFRKADSSEMSTEEQYQTCDLLILDDLGTEFHTAYTDAILYDIINTRMLSNKPTIISTNLTMPELEKSYSARFASRITGYYATMEFLGNDIRIEKKRKGSER